jgi:hypothetical protein
LRLCTPRKRASWGLAKLVESLMEMDLVASARMYCVDESMSEMKARSQFMRRAPFWVTAVRRGLSASDGGAGSPCSALTTSAVMLFGVKYLSRSQ